MKIVNSKGLIEMEKVKNRWLIALSGVGIHICIGSAYAWSVFTKPMQSAYEWTQAQISLAFSIAIFMLGMSAAFMGHFVEKKGPRKSGMLAALFFGIGVAGSGLATAMHSLFMLYLFYGVIGGIGLGIGYIAPVSTLVKWFPDRRGLATGLAIMGFGFAALISGPVAARLIISAGIPATFVILGIIYFAVMIAASQYLSPPPEGWLPAGFKAQIESGKKQIRPDLSQLTANQAVKTRRFWMLWLMLFINVTCGIAILAVASPMAQEIAGMTPLAAATMVGLAGLFNGGGRIGWATISDYIGRPNVYTTFFVIQVIAFFLLPSTTIPIVFEVLVFAILTCYGGGFASVPAYIGDLFGTKELGAIHGYILTAWAVAGVVGPITVSTVHDLTHSYSGTLYFFVVLFVIALALSLLIRLDMKKLRAASRQVSV
jgi:OFA family oxalate/formate antiporter-like MFS transporter